MSINVTASDAPITVSASGTKVDATVSGGQGPQGPIGPAGPQGPSGASNWSEIEDKPTEFPPEDHSHDIADVTDLSDALAEKVLKAGGAMDADAALTFSTNTRNSEVGGWGFGVEVTAGDEYATVEPTAITVAGAGGSTQLTTSGLTLPNATQLVLGSFDNSTGGANGISLICAVGYELNWQGGRLRNVQIGGDGTPQPIFSDSPIIFPGVGTHNVQIDSVGLTFSDGSSQTVAWTGSMSYDDLDDLPTLFDGAYASLTGLPSLFDGAYTSLTSVPSTFAPSAHKSSHATGGSDALTAADVGAAASSHSHGSIDNSGAIATGGPIPTNFVGGPVVFNSSTNVIGKGEFGTAAKTFCQGNDSRLSDARTPLSHTHSAGDLNSGTVATARLGSGTASASNFLRGDGTWATAGSTSASDLTSGTLPEARLPNSVILHPFLLAGM